MNLRFLRTRWAHPLVLAVAVVVGACNSGSDDDASPPTPDAQVEIAARDISWSKTAITVEGKAIEITVKQEGELPHTFLFDQIGYQFLLEVTPPGDTDTEVIELGPGTYTFFCDVPGHRDAGMEGTLTVVAP
ncbi:MAG: cupredoxin domain-containing protein [Actinobacteria bacterium]|nr:cupredoxin domain-containing protein [Actinomycetota bacterium]